VGAFAKVPLMTSISAPATDAKMGASGVSWAIFEGGRNPYVILCTIYILAPYIATTLFPNPVEGQTAIASWNKVAGIIVALTAPLLGAITDKLGHRKPALFVITSAMVVSIFSLWWAVPAGQPGLPIAMVGALITITGVLYAYNEVLHNSMLPVATSPASLPYVSGLGLALGNLASVGLLIFVLWGLAFAGRVDWPFIPKEPLFGLDPVYYETSRIVAPMSAIWLAICAWPLFLMSKDAPATDVPLVKALGEGTRGLASAVKRLFNTDKNAGLFLLARMFYVDGKVAILIFAGLTAAGVFGWDLLEMSAYGVILSIFAVFGGLFSGPLDARIGAKNALLLEIAVSLICLLALTSGSRSRIFGVPIEPDVAVWNGPMFNTLPELVYLGGAVIIAISITGAFASSRTLMARLAPKGMEGEFFGLYSLSGSATIWLGSLLVEYFTRTFNSQQAGLASTGLLLFGGFCVLLFVKQPARLESGTY
jgi:MFS transporter, UMF1 family